MIDEALNLAYHGARAQDQSFNEPRECSNIAFTMPSACLPCSVIFSRLPVNMAETSSISARCFSVSAGSARRDRVLEFPQQID